jgi:phosphoribosylformylglycinamidine cyclo-ligase
LKTPTTYKESGVNIDAGDAFVEAIKPLIKKTQRPEVLSPLGGYAGLFSMGSLKYRDPVLVSSTDGVGTKLKLATEMESFKEIGIDLVAMCVNDLLCVGAEPLFFLDYYACGRLEPERAVRVVEGISEALASIRCSLIGGETAEMPGVYGAEEFDLAGFAVGVVDRTDIIDGAKISAGDKVIGLASSGVHSNGFSLVRKILADSRLDLQSTYPGFTKPLGRVLLEPTVLYVNAVLKLRKQFPILGLAHITGGGLIENLPRILPPQVKALLDRSSWQAPANLDFLQKKGAVEAQEMARVFNCGIGMCVVVPDAAAQKTADAFKKEGHAAALIGEIVPRNDTEEPQVTLNP